MTQTQLKNKFTFWIIDNQTKQQQQGNKGFNNKPKQVCTFSTAEQFWDIFQYMKKPSEFADQTDVYLFKQKIEPLWQDPANEPGGYFSFKIEKNKSNKVWQNAVLSAISPHRNIASCINGVRIKTKSGLDTVQVWMNSSAQDKMVQLKQYLKDCLQITDEKAYNFLLFQFHLKNLKTKEKDSAPYRGRKR